MIKLEDNYRSTTEIIIAANSLIKNNVNQTDKTLIAHKVGPSVGVIEAQDSEAEAHLIKTIVSEDLKRGKAYKDIAVLARTNKFIASVEAALNNADIPCIRVTAENDPLKKPSIKMILNWLNLLRNRRDDIAFRKCAKQFSQAITMISLGDAIAK